MRRPLGRIKGTQRGNSDLFWLHAKRPRKYRIEESVREEIFEHSNVISIIDVLFLFHFIFSLSCRNIVENVWWNSKIAMISSNLKPFSSNEYAFNFKFNYSISHCFITPEYQETIATSSLYDEFIFAMFWVTLSHWCCF